MSPRAAEVLLDVHPALFPAGGGIARYVRDVCAALRDPQAPPARLAFPRNLRGAAQSRFPEFAHQEVPLAWWQLRGLMMLAAPFGRGLDEFYGAPALFHSPLGCGPLFDRGRLIASIHDLTFLHHPEWHPRRTVAFLKATVPAALRRAARVLCDSETVGRQVREELGVPATRVTVLPLAVGGAFRPQPVDAARARIARRFGLDGPFVLHVGTLEPRKNQARLVEAFEQMRASGFGGRLVLAGKDGWRTRAILARIESSPQRAAILRVTDADDEDLAALYACCAVFAMPSLEEGFGLPLLEAMACGAPCVTSDDPALVELGQGCARAVPATDVEALTGALRAAVNDTNGRARAAVEGPRRAVRFGFASWTGRLLAIYGEELAAAGIPRSDRSVAPRARNAW